MCEGSFLINVLLIIFRRLKMRRKFFFFVCLLGCLVSDVVCAIAPGSSVLIAPEALAEADLMMNWQVNLPVRGDESVERMFDYAGYIYVLTDDNYIFCINKKSGQIQFDKQLISPGLPMTEPVYHNNRLWFMVGNELLVLNPYNGAIKEKRKLALGGNLVEGLAINSEFIYLVGKNRISAIVTDGFWRKFMVTADDDSNITSIAVDDRNMFFATVTGNVFCSDAGKARKVWQYDASDKITAPIVLDDGWVYVGSEDTKLYKLDSGNGQNAWTIPFLSGGPILESPSVGKDVVYVTAVATGIHAVDKKTGKSKWNIPSGIGVIAEAGDKAYVFAKPATLIVMNNLTGKEVSRIDITGVTDYSAKSLGSTIYVSSDSGKVVSIGIK